MIGRASALPLPLTPRKVDMKIRILCSLESGLPGVGSCHAGDTREVTDDIGAYMIGIGAALDADAIDAGSAEAAVDPNAEAAPEVVAEAAPAKGKKGK